MQDFAYFKSLYPVELKQMQLCVEEVCDEMEYEGSPIYDEYPDRILLENLTDRAVQKWQSQGKRESESAPVPEKLKAAEKDVWYGPLHGEQKGMEAGYTVWESEEANLTAQERRPWSPPPGPRPGNPNPPWGPPPPPPRPGNPGPPWGPPPPPPRPGNPGPPWGPPPPPPRPGNPGPPWGPPPPPRPDGCWLPGCRGQRETSLKDFFQILLMNELQERRRCRNC